LEEKELRVPLILARNGLNLFSVFDLGNLPIRLYQQLSDNCSDLASFRQLILIGNGGRQFWRSLESSRKSPNNPVDDHSCSVVSQWLDSLTPLFKYRFIYPSTSNIDLQALGKLAGWHYQSPLLVGINNEWGTWFAYRAAILAESDFPVADDCRIETSPCLKCHSKPCLTGCPVNAVSEKSFSLKKCTEYRTRETSECRLTCLSRVSCPVGNIHRYTEAQINYHYSVSLQTILNTSKNCEI